MKTTQRTIRYSRRPVILSKPSSCEPLTAAKDFRAQTPHGERRSPRMISPIITQATHNAGLLLYEILGMAELMRVAYEKGEITSVEARLSILRSEVEDLASGISGILELTKLETETAETGCVSREPFDIVALLHEVSQATRMIVGNKPVTVMGVSCSHPVVITSDRAYIKQIMLCLVSNAAKFTDRGRIALVLGMDDDRIRLTVADTGSGMTQEKVAAALESPDHGYDVEVNGLAATGLGLRIVKRLVKKLDGSISIASKIGEGTIVEVSLPLETVK